MAACKEYPSALYIGIVIEKSLGQQDRGHRIDDGTLTKALPLMTDTRRLINISPRDVINTIMLRNLYRLPLARMWPSRTR